MLLFIFISLYFFIIML